MSTSLFGALAGSAAAFVVGDKLGRKRELLLAATLYGEQETDTLSGTLLICSSQQGALPRRGGFVLSALQPMGLQSRLVQAAVLFLRSKLGAPQVQQQLLCTHPQI